MHYLTALITLVLLCGTAPRMVAADSQLKVEFDTAIAKIAPRASAKPIQLPNLTFTLRVQALCAAPQITESVSVSIADTRITLKPEDDELIEKSIRVSRKQLGPVAVDDFCLDEPGAEAQDSLQISAALTAHLSLRCADDSNASISYETAALNVALQCELPEPEE